MVSRPWLLVTDDGRRPWHREFRVRELADGRRIAYWWGKTIEHNSKEIYARRLCNLFWKMGYSPRPRRSWVKPHRRYRVERLVHLNHSLSGLPWKAHGMRASWLRTDASDHKGDCDPKGFVGMAFLPPPPDCWRPDSIWPGWRHLAHGPEACAQMWLQLEKASDIKLLKLMG